MDLHLHTPASKDYKQDNVTYLDILKQAEKENLDAIAFTDHNTVGGYAAMQQEISDLERWNEAGRLTREESARLTEYKRLLDKIMVLPGFELTATFGFHIIAIFDPETPARTIEYTLLRLNVPPDKVAEGETEVGSTTDVLTAYRIMNEAGALVIGAHANSSHGVAMFGMGLGGQTRIAYTQDPNLHALEVTDLETRKRRSTSSFFNGSKPEYSRRMHCIQGSDSHRLISQGKNPGIGTRVTEIQLSELSFEAIKEVFEGTDFARTRPARRQTEQPFDHVDAARKNGPTIVQSFHENMTRRGGCLHAILCDVVAFANTGGGTIYVGVSPKTRVAPKGVDDANAATKELAGEIDRLVSPQVDVKLSELQSGGKSIIRITVPRGTDKPYVLEGSKIYLRKESETGLAMRDEIVDLVQKALSAAGSAPAPRTQSSRSTSRSQQQRSQPRQQSRPSAKQEPVAEAPAKRQPQRATRRTPRRPQTVAAPAAQPKSEASTAPKVRPEELGSAPHTGVEIFATVERGGQQYHTMRDLRDGGKVNNVTRASARRLWRYAIALKEKGTFSEDKVQWHGDKGLWHKYLRSSRPHYDLVQRTADGDVSIYYGVSEDGIHGEWRAVVGMND